MKKLLLLLFPFCINAQIPEYYQGIDFSTQNDDLKADLTDLITATHTNLLTYTPEVWNTLKVSDLDPTNPNKVLLIYGFDDNAEPKYHRTRDILLTNNGGCGSCIGLWEREHVFPKSLANPSLDTDEPSAGTDAHNLRAVDRQMNSSRSNRPYIAGNGTARTITNGFYPGDEWIGDVARIIMYMYVRYETQCNPNDVVWNSTHINHIEIPDLLLQWNAQDPPTEYELVRNDVIQINQGNRNPFIDNPYLATLTWGGPVAQNNWIELNTNDYQLEEIKVDVTPNPTTDQVQIFAKGFQSVNLYNSTGILIRSENTGQFSISALPAGIYILAIHLENGKIITKKVIKK